MKSTKKAFALALAVVMMLAFAITAWAAPTAQTDNCSLTINFEHNGKPVANAPFSAFKVASVGSGGKAIPTAAFAHYPIVLSGLDTVGLTDAALTLSGFVLRDKIPADFSGKTDQNGKLTFPNNGKRMTPGMYLVIGKPVKHGKNILVPKPFIVTLPYRNEVTGKYNYDITVYPKYDVVPTDEPEIKIEVAKVWHGDNKADRPVGVTVELLRDGVLFETVILNAANSWRHKWTKLEAGHLWTVVEKEVSGYTVSIHNESYVVIINNTTTNPPDEPPTEPPTNPTTPTSPTSPTSPTTPTSPTEPTSPTTPTSPTEPTSPTTPTSPTEPTSPTTPTEPTNPSYPDTPTEPTNPSYPDTPTEPTNPSYPDTPTEPTNPSYPDTPTEPTNPSNPNTPPNPNTPSNPNNPSNPNTPSKPNKPGKPPEIPNTGLLWWPVYIFPIIGLFLFIIGWALVRRREYE